MTTEATWHELKTWPEYFQAILSGHKMFEIRNNDRGFKTGDFLILKEWNPGVSEFTGASLTRKVSFVLEGEDVVNFGLKPGFCIMSISKV